VQSATKTDRKAGEIRQFRSEDGEELPLSDDFQAGRCGGALGRCNGAPAAAVVPWNAGDGGDHG
jgi:hypothetical protein